MKKISDNTNFTYADTDIVDTYADISEDFLLKIFGLTSAFISDESTLSDFMSCCLNDDDDTLDTLTYPELMAIAEPRMYALIDKYYHITVDKHDRLIDVFEKIKQSRNLQ